MLEAIAGGGGAFFLYNILSQTQFAQIKNQNDIAENQCKNIKTSFLKLF